LKIINNILEISIKENLDFENTKDFVEIYKDLKSTGEILDRINIVIDVNSENGEVDPIFLSYLTLFLNDFPSVKTVFTFNKSTSSNRLFSLKLQIEHLFYFNQNLDIYINGSFLVKNKPKVEVSYHYKNGKLKDEIKEYSTPQPIKNILKDSKRFIPPIIINSKESVKEYFEKNENTENVLVEKYWDRIEKTATRLDEKVNQSEFNYFEIFIFRILISDDVKRKITKKEFFNFKNYAKELSKGIKELALNIAEHSKNINGDIQSGIITARIFEKERLLNLKAKDSKKFLDNYNNSDFFIDLNILDVGATSVRKTYAKNIEKNGIKYGEKLKGINFEKEKNSIEQQKFKDFYDINIKNLTEHQNGKLISRYGLQFFTHILKERFNGFIKVSSSDEAVVIHRNQIKDDTKIGFFEYGTFYNCIAPLKSFIDLSDIDELNEIQSEENLIPTDSNSYMSVKDSKLIQYDKGITVSSNSNIYNININYFGEINFYLEYEDKYELLDNFIVKFLEIPQKERSYMYSMDCENIPFNSSDWLRLLPILTLNFKNLILYNIPLETVAKLIEIRTLRYHKKLFNFWAEGSNILFFSKKDSDSANIKRFGATVLIGKSPNEYNYINFQIWKHRYSFKECFAFEQKKNKRKLIGLSKNSPELIIKNSLLFGENSILKYFELIIKNETPFGDKISLFEQSIQYSLNKNLIENITNSDTNNKGYKIPNTHFRLGSKIHIKDFYYAKRMFQNSFFTTPIAFLIAQEIYEKNKLLIPNATLIGYDGYSELLITTIRHFITLLIKENNHNNTFKSINHTTLVETGFTRDYNTITDNLFIIVPIASTFSTSIKVQQQLIDIFKRNDLTEKNRKIHSPFYNVLLVGHTNFETKIEKKDHFLQKKFNWRPTKNIQEIDVIPFNEEITISQKYLIPIYSDWSLSEKCEQCYPINYLDEKCLNETRIIPITPNVIFGLPKIYQELDDENNIKLNYNDSLLYGNIRYKSFKYLYYIKTGSLVSKNTEKITKWLNDLKTQLSNYKVFHKKIVIVTPSSSTKSNFVNLVNEVVFNFTANCVSISLKEDFINNSKSLYEDALNGADFVFYVDDVLSTINSYNEINYLVSYIRYKNKSKKGIDLCISLINRMTFDSELEVRRSLTKKEGHTKKLFYLTRLHNPSIQEPNSEFPLDVEYVKFNKLANTSSLDPIQTIHYQKSDDVKEINISKSIPPDLIRKGNNKINQLLTVDAIYSLFKVKISRKDNSLSKNKLFFDEYIIENKIKEIFQYRRLKLLVEYIRDILNLDEREDEKIKFTLFRILTNTPLVYYLKIKESVFEWVLLELDIYISKASNLKNDKQINEFLTKNVSGFSDYQTLKYLLKRSIQLDSNIIFHNDFLNKIKLFFNSVYKYENIETELITNLIPIFNNIEYLNNQVFINNQLKTLKINEGLQINENLTNMEDGQLAFSEEQVKFQKERIIIENLIEKFKKDKEIQNKLSLKKFVYKYVSLIEELIDGHEIKAVRLEDNISNYNCNGTKNGNFNHLIRLIKLENTSAIENFKYFFEKQLEPNFNSTEKNLLDKIKSFHQDPKLKNIDKLILSDKESIGSLNFDSPFFNFIMLNTKLNEWKSEENSKESIDEQINEILKYTTRIVGLTGNESGGAFFTINFTNQNNEEIEPSNLFQFKKFNTDNNKLNITSVDSKNSLTYKMFKGIKVLNGISNKGKFELSNFEVIKKDKSYLFRDKLNITQEEVQNSLECKYADIGENDYNLLFLKISNKNLKAQAVLSYYLSIGERIDEKKLRLLLLLRKSISSFINTQFDNDSLRAYIEQEKIKIQFGNLGHLKKKINDFLKETNSLEAELFFNKLLLYKNRLQQISLNKENEDYIEVLKDVGISDNYINSEIVSQRINYIKETLLKPWISEKKVSLNIDIEQINGIVFFPDILDEIFTESIHNISKNVKSCRHYKNNEILNIEIKYNNNYLFISNNQINENISERFINLNIIHSKKVNKKFNGLNMLNNIIYNLFQENISVVIANSIFTVKIPLKSITNE
jgi:hypothetical protein